MPWKETGFSQWGGVGVCQEEFWAAVTSADPSSG